jgi:hypothetical protein
VDVSILISHYCSSNLYSCMPHFSLITSTYIWKWLRIHHEYTQMNDTFDTNTSQSTLTLFVPLSSTSNSNDKFTSVYTTSGRWSVHWLTCKSIHDGPTLRIVCIYAYIDGVGSRLLAGSNSAQSFPTASFTLLHLCIILCMKSCISFCKVS